MDETALSIRREWRYLYRAVDRNGKSVHSLLSEDRTVDSAQEFFRQAIKVAGSGCPDTVNLDGNTASHCAQRLLRQEDSRWQSVNVRARRYLNNIVEQDHRAISRLCAPMLGLKSFATAAVTLSGIELAHRIRKRQFTVPYECNGGALSLKALWDQAISGESPSGVLEIIQRPLTHQISIPALHSRLPGPRTRRGVVRYTRKVSFGRSLYLLVTPKGGRYWRYRYRFQGRERMLALGCYPEVPTKSARARHQAARRLLALGIDPAGRRKALRQINAELV